MAKRTLENPMLYSNFVKQIQRSDPDFDIDIIDRTLEPDEALRELTGRHGLRTSRKSDEFDPMKEFRSNLFDTGIKHPRMQNFVMRQEKPPSNDDLDLLAYVMGARPHANIKRDIKRKARPARTVRQYAKNPNRYDVVGVDTPGSILNIDWF